LDDRISVISRSARKFVKKLIQPLRSGAFPRAGKSRSRCNDGIMPQPWLRPSGDTPLPPSARSSQPLQSKPFIPAGFQHDR
jgi:hypothetical protein